LINFFKKYGYMFPLYLKLRRYGFTNTLRRYYYSRQQACLRVPKLARQGAEAHCEVHVLTSAWDWDLALWAVGSFYHFSEVNWPLVVHDGGGMRPEWFARFEQLFPGCRVVSCTEANELVNSTFQNRLLPATLHARTNCKLMRKVIDTAVVCQASRYVLLDSDVLFFQKPCHLLNLLKGTDGIMHLLRDYQDSYSIEPEAAIKELGIQLPPEINTGLALIPKLSVDFQAIEDIFAKRMIPLDKDGFAEQTVLALLAQRHGFDYLPSDYAVVTGPLGKQESPGVCRHYVGPVKKLFFDEGVPRFINSMRASANGR
jgi:hypothetical protein